MGRRKPGSLSSLRELNRLKVLEVVRERGTVSRAEIAMTTGLARSTVSSLVGDLQRAGLVVENEDARAEGPTSSGRPPLLLSLDPGAGAVLGIHFDHDYVRVAVADLSLTLLAEGVDEIDVDHDAEAGLDVAAELATRCSSEAGVPSDRLLGAGVALSGPIDRTKGQVSSPTILPGWVGVDVAARLTRRLGLSVHVDNDANLGALAESVLGAGRDASEMVYVMLSSGIGGGLILGGRLYRGARGSAGEIGHVSVDENGPMCRCGNRGCLETMVGAGALIELLRPSHGEDLTIEHLVALAREGRPRLPARARRRRPHRRTRAGRALQRAQPRADRGRRRAGRGRRAAARPDAGIGAPLRDPRRGRRPFHRRRPARRAGRALGALALVMGQSERVLSGRLKVAVGR